MRLLFHGARYEHQPSDVTVTEGKVGGTYRGQAWKVHHYQKPLRRQPHSVEMLYRGVRYQKS